MAESLADRMQLCKDRYNDIPQGLIDEVRALDVLAKMRLMKDADQEPEKQYHSILHCSSCMRNHIDEGEWATRPHHTHECQYCGFQWRVEPYTFGIKSTKLDW